MKRVGYLVPQFPGQTHIFFWRELRALRALGWEPHLVSTREPPRETICHKWSQEALRQTHYLAPPSSLSLLLGGWMLLRCGPSKWLACLRAVLGAEGERPIRRLRLFGLMFMGAQLAALARQSAWSHVHVQSCADSAYIAMFGRILGNLSYSLVLHGPLKYFGGGQSQKWRHAAFAITVTRRLRDEVLQALPEIAENRISVAAMGVDFQVFVRRTPYRPASSTETARLVTCGRLHHGKGHQDLVRAVSLLVERKRSVHLTVLGEGPARAALTALVDELELNETVRLVGAASEDVVRDTLEASHLFVLASHEEAIGVATMEAMAMSLPVVVTRVGGVSELVREGVDGLFVEPRNPEVLATAIERLHDAPELAEQMGKMGVDRVRRSFRSEFSADVIDKRLSVPAYQDADDRAVKTTLGTADLRP